MENPNDQREGKPPEGGGRREPSDRWDFSSVPPAASQIPELKEIPETPEERRRRKIILSISAVVAAIVLVTAVLIFLSIRHGARIAGAVEDYQATGRVAYLDDALDLLEGDDEPADRALRARLHATAWLEHARAEGEEAARQTLESLGEQAPPGTGVARTYLALAAGQPQQASQVAAHVQVKGDYVAEAARAQALAASSVGALPQAIPLAERAVDEQSEAPRHLALLARLLARSGQPDEGLEKLDELEDAGEGAPLVHLARARIALHREDLATAKAQAEKVLDGEASSPVEGAWGQLVRAYVLARHGDAAGALARAEKAAVHRPPGDEAFVLWRGKALLEAGAVEEANEELQRLPDAVTSLPQLRAHTVAELALARGNPKSAAAALSSAPKGPRTTLLRARVAEARGKLDEARELYAQAAEAEPVKAEALARRSTLELAQDETAAAVEAASKALTAGPAHPEAVTAFVRAKVVEGDPKAARGAADKALEQRPADGRLLAARAHVEMAAEDWKAARGTLEEATKRLPRDGDLYAQLGEARRRLGQADPAVKAFEQALALDAAHPGALTGLLQIHVEARELEKAGAILERIDEADVVSVPVDRARARYYVLTSAGHAGAGEVRKAIVRRARDDADQWMSLARLQMQAGRARQAVASFGRVLRQREGDPHALLGRALAQLRLGMKGGAERTLEKVDEAIEGKDLGERFKATHLAAQARHKLLDDRLGAARGLARQALEVDPNNAEAHLVLADVMDERDRDPTEHLRAALEAPIPPPEAKGRLALELEGGEERCELARAYREAAPRGRYGRSIRRIVRSCR